MKHFYTKALATLVAGLAFSSASQADLFVIGHAELRIASLTAKEVRSVFLNKKIKGLKYSKVQLVLPPAESESTERFIRQALKMTPSKFQGHWSSQVFTGKGAMPIYTDAQDEIVEMLQEKKNIIAVIDAEEAPKNTKLLYILEE